MAIKVKTFTNTLEIFKTIGQLSELDEKVNSFIAENEIKKVISISDAVTTTDMGTQGIVRVIAYETNQ
ncbi:MAG: hypothetical protein ACXAEU_04925 [Candidatus Hodarchaeales archaeon]|jgi:hypothetical protein